MPGLIEMKRKEMRLSQEKVSKRLGITRQYYNAIENGRRPPSVKLAKDLGSLLKFDWTIFFTNQVNK